MLWQPQQMHPLRASHGICVLCEFPRTCFLKLQICKFLEGGSKDASPTALHVRVHCNLRLKSQTCKGRRNPQKTNHAGRISCKAIDRRIPWEPMRVNFLEDPRSTGLQSRIEIYVQKSSILPPEKCDFPFCFGSPLGFFYC